MSQIKYRSTVEIIGIPFYAGVKATALEYLRWEDKILVETFTFQDRFVVSRDNLKLIEPPVYEIKYNPSPLPMDQQVEPNEPAPEV